MNTVLVDANVLLDIFEDDEHWASWSESTLNAYASSHTLAINAVIYAEVSIGFVRIEEMEEVIAGGGFRLLEIPKEALFLAGKVFLAYRRQGGQRRSPLPDFFIGAHAAVTGMALITRDAKRYRSYFPRLQLVTPPP